MQPFSYNTWILQTFYLNGTGKDMNQNCRGHLLSLASRDKECSGPGYSSNMSQDELESTHQKGVFHFYSLQVDLDEGTETAVSKTAWPTGME